MSCWQQRLTLCPWYNSVSWGEQPATWWQVDYISLTGTNLVSGCGFAITVCRAAASTSTHGLTECLIHPSGILNNIASDQRPHLTAKECISDTTRIHCSCTYSTNQKLPSQQSGSTASSRRGPLAAVSAPYSGCTIFLNSRVTIWFWVSNT